MNNPWRFSPCKYNSSELSSMYHHFVGIVLPSTPCQVTPQIIQLPSTEPRTVESSCSNKLYDLIPSFLPSSPFHLSQRNSPLKPASRPPVSLVPPPETMEMQPPTPEQITQKPSSGGVSQHEDLVVKPKAKRTREPKPIIPPERISQRKRAKAKRDSVCNAGTQRSESRVLSPIKPGDVDGTLPNEASSKRLYRYLKPNGKAAAESNSVRCFSQAVAKKHRNSPNPSARSTAGLSPSRRTQNQNQSPKDYYGCWTCRVRHCSCPADGKPCSMCIRYGYDCDNSPFRPSYIKCARKRKERIRFLQKMRRQ